MIPSELAACAVLMRTVRHKGQFQSCCDDGDAVIGDGDGDGVGVGVVFVVDVTVGHFLLRRAEDGREKF